MLEQTIVICLLQKWIAFFPQVHTLTVGHTVDFRPNFVRSAVTKSQIIKLPFISAVFVSVK
jgi:hypothetical protein